MTELEVPTEYQPNIPRTHDPRKLILLTVGIVGELAFRVAEASGDVEVLLESDKQSLGFAATFFDSLIVSDLGFSIEQEALVYASAAYLMAGRPGSSLVLARRLAIPEGSAALQGFLVWLLKAGWHESSTFPNLQDSSLLHICDMVVRHFGTGADLSDLWETLTELRMSVYSSGSSHDVLAIDVAAAVIAFRIHSSAWIKLPAYSGLTMQWWSPALRRRGFATELWPSQERLGELGFFQGRSGIIQMPTSSGKTRAIELILRSHFGRTPHPFAVVVVPFRALCHEIGHSFRKAFEPDEVSIQELTDLPTAENLLLGREDQAEASRPVIVILTPEKLVYLLRQDQTVVTYLSLIIYDEAHQFDSPSRGVTYELLMSEVRSRIPTSAQTILVSAVLPDVENLSRWLFSDTGVIASGNGLQPTSRSIAFASWAHDFGSLQFFDELQNTIPDFFVPRTIIQNVLEPTPRQRVPRLFPERTNVGDIALYLGLRCCTSGAVAIFCGRKDSANKIARRALEVFELGAGYRPPRLRSRVEQLTKLEHQLELNLGPSHPLTQAARLGITVHHGAIPQGIRSSIEYGMHVGDFHFVICTSTLAQGVNMPIRYLIVAATGQGKEPLKSRDFQNLMGRAGRAGMHTEGLTIFADPKAFDGLPRNSYYFSKAKDLVNPQTAETLTSALASLVSPMVASTESDVFIPFEDFATLLLLDTDGFESGLSQLAMRFPTFTNAQLNDELQSRRKMIIAVESYLMSIRQSDTSESFFLRAEESATQTLAFQLLADIDGRKLTMLFRKVAEFLEENSVDDLSQERFSRTMLGIRRSLLLERWVLANLRVFDSIDDEIACLEHVWEIVAQNIDLKKFSKTQPANLTIEVVRDWMVGKSYLQIWNRVSSENHGSIDQAGVLRKLSYDDLMWFLENGLGYQASLVISAIRQTLEAVPASTAILEVFSNFQHSIKYGLQGRATAELFEFGFNDRELCKQLSQRIELHVAVGTSHVEFLKTSPESVLDIVALFPRHFDEVLRGLGRR